MKKKTTCIHVVHIEHNDVILETFNWKKLQWFKISYEMLASWQVFIAAEKKEFAIKFCL